MPTLANSGQLKFSEIRTLYALSNEQSGTITLSDYYRGVDKDDNGPIVSNAGITSNIPSSGAITMSNFRGTGHSFGNATTLETLTNHARGYVFSNGTRSPADKVRNYCVIYNSSQVVPSGCSATNGIYNLSNGKKYSYVTMTSGDRNGNRRLGNSNSTVPSRMYNSGQTREVMDDSTLVSADAGTNPQSFNNRVGSGRIGTFTRTNQNINAGDGSSTNGVLIMKNTQDNSDAGKGNIVCYVFDYRFMSMLYDDVSSLGTLRNTL